jgi:predicted nuclease with TOPRIM domain
MSSGVTPHSDELKSPTRHTSYMSKEEFMASIGHNGSESQDTKHTPMPPKSPKSPDQVHIEILKALAKAALGFASIQDDKQRAEIQRQQTDANIMLGEDFLSKQDLMAEPSFGPILAEVAKVEAKTLKDIECTEGKLSLLNGKPVLVTSEIVNHNSNKYLKLTISSIGDKSISDLFDEDTLKRSGLAMGSLDPISSLKMISKGELPFPLEVDNANGAFFNAINNSDDDAVDTCILINTEDTTDILLRNPEYGKYSDQQELALRKMTIKNNQLAKAFAEEKAEKEHYKETNKKVCDEHDKLDDEYKKIKNDFDTQTTNFAKANKSAQKLRAKLRRTTQLANDAKAAGLKVDGNGMPDIPDQDLRDAANGTFKKADGKTLSYYSDDDGA